LQIQPHKIEFYNKVVSQPLKLITEASPCFPQLNYMGIDECDMMYKNYYCIDI
jgi:hypothetical protein